MVNLLKATHVSDTASKTYEPLVHIMPLFGFTGWPAMMLVLREIDYQGDFSYEAHNYAKRLPDELLPSALRFSYEIGQYLMSLQGRVKEVFMSGSTPAIHNAAAFEEIAKTVLCQTTLFAPPILQIEIWTFRSL